MAVVAGALAAPVATGTSVLPVVGPDECGVAAAFAVVAPIFVDFLLPMVAPAPI